MGLHPHASSIGFCWQRERRSLQREAHSAARQPMSVQYLCRSCSLSTPSAADSRAIEPGDDLFCRNKHPPADADVMQFTRPHKHFDRG
jgi:hypothetical protein